MESECFICIQSSAEIDTGSWMEMGCELRKAACRMEWQSKQISVEGRIGAAE